MDTIMIIRDSVATCLKETAEICLPCVKEAETSWQDVIIWVTLFVAFAYVVRYGIKQYFKCKKDERDASAVSAKEKRENDVKDRQWKLEVDKEAHELKRKEEQDDHEKKLEEEQKAHELKRKEEQEALDKKRRTDLQDKLLCQLKDLAEIERDADGNEIIKNNDNSKEYITMLQTMISKLDSPTNTPNEQEA